MADWVQALVASLVALGAGAWWLLRRGAESGARQAAAEAQAKALEAHSEALGALKSTLDVHSQALERLTERLGPELEARIEAAVAGAMTEHAAIWEPAIEDRVRREARIILQELKSA